MIYITRYSRTGIQTLIATATTWTEAETVARAESLKPDTSKVAASNDNGEHGTRHIYARGHWINGYSR